MSEQAQSTAYVLLVDDDVELRDTIASALHLDGYTVAEAGTVVVVHDVNLGFYGGKLTDEVVEFYEAQGVPLIAFTGLPSSAPRGATRVVCKGSSFRSLLDAITSALTAPAAQDGAPRA